jgi:hypothetical protein
LISLRIISVSFFLIISVLTADAGDPWRISAGAGEAGTAFSCISQNTFWSGFHNQAILADINAISAGINYENRFGMKELSVKSAAVIIPTGRAVIGGMYSNFGFSGFTRHSGILACGMKLSEKISAGTQIDFFSENTPLDYSKSNIMTFEAGLLMKPKENLRIGIHVFNPVRSMTGRLELPSRITLGAGMLLGNSLFAGAEAEMSSDKRVGIRAGFDYESMKRIRLRGGFSTENTSFAFGIGYVFDNLKIDIGFITHETLGITSSASMIFILNNKKVKQDT